MIYILIPAFNNKPEVLEVLQCLYRQTYKDYKIVLVDDNSTDGTREAVQTAFPETTILVGDGNLWWTGANVLGVNHILKEANVDDFILLLNNDLIVEDDYLENMLDAALKSHGIIGSMLFDINDKETIKNAGILLSDDLTIVLNMTKIILPNSDLEYYNTDVLPGRGTLYPVEVINKIGNLDKKKFPHYGADYEFSHRAGQAGYKLLVAHKAHVYAKLEITGLKGDPKAKLISLKHCFDLLFSKKSVSNIFYYLNYTWICSKKEFRLKNSTNAFIGIISSTFFKTIPGIVVFNILLVIKRIFDFIFFFYRFLFVSFDFTNAELIQFGLEEKKLLAAEIITKNRFKKVEYFNFCKKDIVDKKIDNLSNIEKEGVQNLRRLSNNYFYKVKTVINKFFLIRQAPGKG